MGFMDKLTKGTATNAAPANDLIDLKKKAGIVLEKKNMASTKAAVYLVIDHSGSMSGFYRNHTVQDFVEKVLAVATNLDDDGTVPVVLFDTHAHEPFIVNVNNFNGSVDAMIKKAGHMGTTNYADAMRKIIELHGDSTEPALVIFQTDGSPDSRRDAEQVLCEAANLPIFWQFVGFGNDSFDFLQKLDDLPVPQKRVIDNADFFPAGNDPKNMPTEELYDKLLNEFPGWLAQAKAQGIVK